MKFLVIFLFGKRGGDTPVSSAHTLTEEEKLIIGPPIFADIRRHTLVQIIKCSRRRVAAGRIIGTLMSSAPGEEDGGC